MPQVPQKLQNNTRALCEWTLCWVRMLEDPELPWVMLVPKREGLSEWHQLSPEDQAQLSREVAEASRRLEEAFGPTKVNVGALGNIVADLHIHVIARYEGDRAWPGPVWGTSAPRDEAAVEALYKRLLDCFSKAV